MKNAERRQYTIQISIAAKKREEAIAYLERKLSWMKEAQWPDTCEAGGGMGGPNFEIVFGHQRSHSP